MSSPAINPFRGYTCYVCGRQKGDVNHWWMLSIEKAVAGNGDGISSLSFIHRLTVNPWRQCMADDPSFFPACGSNDVAVLVERFLTTGTFEPQRVAANPNPAEPPTGETTV